MIRNNLKSWCALAALLIVWLIFFSRTLFFRQIYFLDDLKIIYYPLEQVYAQFQSRWELPQWSNEFGFGQPLLAWGQLGFFTPLHVLLRALQIHPLILLQISIVTYFGAGLLGMYTFCRKRNLSRPASIVGAVVFAFSGYTVAHLNHVNFYTATMLLPWLLVSIEAFIRQPTVKTTALMSLLAAAITVSGQPQVVMHTLVIGAMYGFIRIIPALVTNRSILYAGKSAGLAIVAAVTAIALSSFAILPLAEFLPTTERGEDLPLEELYEFSYPPHHAITLVFPYFFGDHESYWGAKGFQELAAYVGIIPLLLLGPALTQWRTNRTLRATGIAVIILGIFMALGRHSPFYVYLVESHVLATLSVPGRAVYLVVTGIALLSALGTDDAMRIKKISKIAALLAAAALIATAGAPLLSYLQEDPRALAQLEALLELNHQDVWLAILGIAAVVGCMLLSHIRHVQQYGKFVLAAGTAATLIVLGWNYNPLTPWQRARQPSPFADELAAFREQTGIPPRLYSHQLMTEPPSGPPKLTNPLSPALIIHQPITIEHDNLKCLTVTLDAGQGFGSRTIEIALRENIGAAPLRHATLTVTDTENPEQTVCFEPLTASYNKKAIVSIYSSDYSDLRLLARPATSEETQAYFVPTAHAPETLEQTRKNVSIPIKQQSPPTVEEDRALLTRHLHVTAGASSARWIGALSIKSYRAFIEQFFANDREPVDGDGAHVLERHRKAFNMAGVTHLIQPLAGRTDHAMTEAGFEVLENTSIGTQRIALYRNPQAFPKVFMVRNAVWEPGKDQTRFAILQQEYQPENIIYFDAPTPPRNIPAHSNAPLDAHATIIRYEPTRVDVAVDAHEPAFLVLADAATPQWQTYINNHPTEPMIANSIFRAALVPAGKSTVSFRYYSPATETAKKTTMLGLATSAALLLIAPIKRITKSL